MNENESEQIKIRINNLMQLRNNYINIVVVVAGGVVGMVLSALNFIKIVFILFGIYLVIIFLANIERCNIQIEKQTEDLTK